MFSIVLDDAVTRIFYSLGEKSFLIHSSFIFFFINSKQQLSDLCHVMTHDEAVRIAFGQTMTFTISSSIYMISVQCSWCPDKNGNNIQPRNLQYDSFSNRNNKIWDYELLIILCHITLRDEKGFVCPFLINIVYVVNN